VTAYRVDEEITTFSRDPSGIIASTNGGERRRHVDPSARGAQHPLDQVGRLTGHARIVVVSSLRPRRATKSRPPC
jgi:hypothetical protein